MIERLVTIFGKPDSADVVAYLKEVRGAVEGYSIEVQDAACTLIRDAQASRQFPTPAICKKACQTITDERGQEAMRQPLPVMNQDWTVLAKSRADRLIQCRLGQRAASEGWVLGLHDFCRKKGRLPVNHEIGVIMANAKEFDEAYRVAQETPGSSGAAMVKLGTAMLSRRDRCARVADGEVLP